MQAALESVLTPRIRQPLSDGGAVARYPGGPAYSLETARGVLAAVEAAGLALRAVRPKLFQDDGGTVKPGERIAASAYLIQYARVISNQAAGIGGRH